MPTGAPPPASSAFERDDIELVKLFLRRVGSSLDGRFARFERSSEHGS